MAVKIPISAANDGVGTDFYALPPADLSALHDIGLYVYSFYTGVNLSVVGSGGTLAGLPMTDTRLQAGASTTDVTNFDTEAETPNISTVTINYARLTQTINPGAIPPNTSNLAWPLALTGSDPNQNLQAMTSTDFYDTFVAPVLGRLQGDTDTNPNPYGTYTVSTSQAVSGAVLVSATPIYTDTRANTAAYTAGGIGEVQDQPTTINNYYLHRYTPDAAIIDDTILPIYCNAGNENIYQHTLASWVATLGPWLQYYTQQAGSASSNFRYNINGAGTTVGTSMINTILNGTSAAGYTQLYVNTNDYRTQEFPNGVPVTANTYALRRT